MDTDDELRTHIERLLSCKVVEYLGQTIVDESFKGTPVWRGVVHHFHIEGNQDSNYCYAWSSPIEGSDKRKFYAVLHISPVDSPQAAVRASIVSDYKDTNRP